MHRLGSRGSPSRTPSTGSIPTVWPETVARMNNWRRTSEQPGHPCRATSQPGQSRPNGSLGGATPRRACTTVLAAPAFEEKAPLSNLCKPTSCQQAPCRAVSFRVRIPACAGPAAVFEPCLSARTACASSETTLSTAAPVSRLHGVPGPGWCRVWCRGPPAVPIVPLPREGASRTCQGSGRNPRRALSSRTRATRRGHRCSLSRRTRLPISRSSEPPGAEDPFRRQPTKATASRIRSIFHRRVLVRPAPVLALGNVTRRPPPVPRLSRLGPASDTLSRTTFVR